MCMCNVHPLRRLVIVFLLSFTLLCMAPLTVGAADNALGLGRLLTGEEINKLLPPVFANGDGLPAGTGNVAQGEPLYQQQCAGCHGSQGEGGSALELVGDRALLATEYPDKGVAVYWPYASTLFNYIRRAMPPGQPYSLSVDDTYAVIAKVLQLNGLISADTTITNETLPGIAMPNLDGFIDVQQ